MAVWRGITYLEKTKSPASPVEALGNNMSQAEKTYLLAWDARSTSAGGLGSAVPQILGYPTIGKVSSSVSYIQRLTPMPHPEWVDSTGRPFMHATQITRMVPIGLPADAVVKKLFATTVGQIAVARYFYAEATIRFETLTYDIRNDNEIVWTNGAPDESFLQRYVTRRPATSAEYLALPYGSFKYVTAGMPIVPGQPGKIVPGQDIRLTWHQVPASVVGSLSVNPTLSTPVIDQTLGKVNSTAFSVSPTGAGGYAAGTLLCMSPELEPLRSPFGDRMYNITYHFKYFAPGWNTIYNARSGAYLEVSSTGATFPLTTNGVHLYDAANFNALFQPAS